MQTVSPDDTEPAPEAARRRWAWWTPTRIALALVVVALVSMWVYVLYLAFGPGRQPPCFHC